MHRQNPHDYMMLMFIRNRQNNIAQWNILLIRSHICGIHSVYFISNAAKMRLVLNFSIFRVVAYFRCLASLKIIVIA